MTNQASILRAYIEDARTWFVLADHLEEIGDGDLADVVRFCGINPNDVYTFLPRMCRAVVLHMERMANMRWPTSLGHPSEAELLERLRGHLFDEWIRRKTKCP